MNLTHANINSYFKSKNTRFSHRISSIITGQYLFHTNHRPQIFFVNVALCFMFIVKHPNKNLPNFKFWTGMDWTFPHSFALWSCYYPYLCDSDKIFYSLARNTHVKLNNNVDFIQNIYNYGGKGKIFCQVKEYKKIVICPSYQV